MSICATSGVVFVVLVVFPKTEQAAARAEMATIDQSDIEKGFEASSVGEIAQRAHASKETFYSKKGQVAVVTWAGSGIGAIACD